MTARQRTSEPVAIQDYLGHKSPLLLGLCSHASRLAFIQENIRSSLPPAIRSHFTVANFDHKVLVVHTDSPAWAARLRFHIPEILKYAKDTCDLAAVSTVRIKVKVPEDDSVSSARKFVLSERSREFLVETAESSSDPAIRESLKRLAEH